MLLSDRQRALSETQIEWLEAGMFRFYGWSHGDSVVEAQALIRAGYVTSSDIGGPSYTCIQCEISAAGVVALRSAGRATAADRDTGRCLVL